MRDHPNTVVETIYLPSTLLSRESLTRIQVHNLDFEDKWSVQKKPTNLTKALIEAALKNLQEHNLPTLIVCKHGDMAEPISRALTSALKKWPTAKAAQLGVPELFNGQEKRS